MDATAWVDRNRIFETVSGSQAYGLSTPESDVDLRGVTVPPKEAYFGMQGFEQHESKDPDRTIFSVKKFVTLATENNPNILELLFVPDDVVVLSTPYWDAFRENRDLFLSRKALHTFSGYAFAQLKRVNTHRAWLLNPPAKRPERADFGLGEDRSKVSASNLGVIQAAVDAAGGNDPGFLPPSLMDLFRREKSYSAAVFHYEQYETWKRTRNKKRAAMEAKCGYDSKHMSHVFRLLAQGEEILSRGTLTVRLPNDVAEECRAVRRGEFPYDVLMERADARMARLKEIEPTSPLPYGPNRKAINAILVSVTDRFLAENPR